MTSIFAGLSLGSAGSIAGVVASDRELRLRRQAASANSATVMAASHPVIGVSLLSPFLNLSLTTLASIPCLARSARMRLTSSIFLNGPRRTRYQTLSCSITCCTEASSSHQRQLGLLVVSIAGILERTRLQEDRLLERAFLVLLSCPLAASACLRCRFRIGRFRIGDRLGVAGQDLVKIKARLFAVLRHRIARLARQATAAQLGGCPGAGGRRRCRPERRLAFVGKRQRRLVDVPDDTGGASTPMTRPRNRPISVPPPDFFLAPLCSADAVSCHDSWTFSHSILTSIADS